MSYSDESYQRAVEQRRELRRLDPRLRIRDHFEEMHAKGLVAPPPTDTTATDAALDVLYPAPLLEQTELRKPDASLRIEGVTNDSTDEQA